MRFSAVGNVLELSNPKGMWMKYFGDKLQVGDLLTMFQKYTD